MMSTEWDSWIPEKQKETAHDMKKEEKMSAVL